jgi:hypothetical protein
MELTLFTTFATLALVAVAAGCSPAETTTEDSEDDNTSPVTDGPNAGEGALGKTGAWCAPVPACDTAPPDPGAKVHWNSVLSGLIAATGKPNHRGRDLFLNPSDPQRVIAKFSYGLFDKDLKGEQVDLYLQRDCGDDWEFLGTTKTTQEGEHESVEGVDDSGGRVYFEIPPEKKLGLGRHRIHLVVRGDLSSTDAFVEVAPAGAPVFVSDVDGTLTGTETEEFTALLSGKLPSVHPDAAKAFRILVSKGYHSMYLTARPEWLMGRTREFLTVNQFPPGIVHTTLGLTGAKGSQAAGFKTDELRRLGERGLVPAWAFGNTSTDAEAYESSAVEPLSNRVFYQFDDNVYGGRRIESYTELLEEIDALPNLCD